MSNPSISEEAAREWEPCLTYFSRYAELRGIQLVVNERDGISCFLRFVTNAGSEALITAEIVSVRSSDVPYRFTTTGFTLRSGAFPPSYWWTAICQSAYGTVPVSASESEFFKILDYIRQQLEDCTQHYVDIGPTRYFIDMLNDKNKWYAYSAVDALKKINTQESLDSASRYIQSDSVLVEYGYTDLSKFDYAKAWGINESVAELNHPSSVVRESARKYLEKTKSEQVS